MEGRCSRLCDRKRMLVVCMSSEMQVHLVQVVGLTVDDCRG
jgi:hypothetical protein